MQSNTFYVFDETLPFQSTDIDQTKCPVRPKIDLAPYQLAVQFYKDTLKSIQMMENKDAKYIINRDISANISQVE